MTISSILPYGIVSALSDSGLFSDIAIRVSDQTILLLHIYVLASAILVSAITTGLVFKNARQMKGGVFGTVLNYFGVGMVFILLGYLVSALSLGLPETTTQAGSMYSILIGGSLHAILYIIGYVIMAIAAHKLLIAIKGA